MISQIMPSTKLTATIDALAPILSMPWLYSNTARNLHEKEGELFDKGILISSGENVRGATVFRTIVADPPQQECHQDFVLRKHLQTLFFW